VQLAIRDDSLKLGILAHVGVALTAEHERHLLEGHLVLAISHDLCHQGDIVDLLSYAESLRELLVFSVNFDDCSVSLGHLIGVSGVGSTTEQVDAYSIEVCCRRELCQVLKSLDLQEEINGLGFLVMVDELWNYLVDQLIDLVSGEPFLNASLVLIPNVGSEAAQVLVTPSDEVLLRA